MASKTANTPPLSDRPERSHRAWLTVAALFLSSLVVQGTALGGITMFDAHILKALDVTRGAFKFRDTVYAMSIAGFSFAMPWICSWIGVRTTLIAGLAALSVVLAGYSFVTSLDAVYGLQLILGFSSAATHVVMVMIVLARWFEADDPRRGIALGITVAGASSGAALLSGFAALALEHLPWRTVFLGSAALPLLLVPFVWAVVRPPIQGIADPWGLKVRKTGLSGFAWGDLLTWPTLILAVAVLPIFYVASSIATNLVLMLTGKGVTTAAAAGAVSLWFLSGLIGKVASGFVLMRLQLLRAWLSCVVLMLAGSLLLWTAPSFQMAAIAMVGLGWGGGFPLAQLQIATVFPGPSLARVLGAFVVLESLGAAAGATGSAVLADRFGYDMALGLNAFLLLAALTAGACLGGAVSPIATRLRFALIRR